MTFSKAEPEKGIIVGQRQNPRDDCWERDKPVSRTFYTVFVPNAPKNNYSCQLYLPLGAQIVDQTFWTCL